MTEKTPYERENRRGLHKGQRSIWTGRFLKIRSRTTYRLAVGYTIFGELDNSRIASEKTLMENVDGRSYSSFCLLRAEKYSEAFIYWCHESSRAINADIFRFCLHVRRYKTLVVHARPPEVMFVCLRKHFNMIVINMLIIFIPMSHVRILFRMWNTWTAVQSWRVDYAAV
jgi:hypothetical protein